MQHSELTDLSSYLDGDLDESRTRRLEEHLRDCVSCRLRLDGLGRTVRLLRHATQEAPPPELASRVYRRLAWERRSRGRLAALEEWLHQWMPRPAVVASAAIVVSLATIVYLFATGVGLRQPETSPDLAPETPPPASVMRMEADAIFVSGRAFVRSNGVWVERGLVDEPIARRLDWREARELGLLEAVPGVEGLEEQGMAVVLRFREEVVRIESIPPR